MQVKEQRLFRLQNARESFGQPTPLTHPHLLQKGELIQGTTAEEIRGRRQRLLENIQKYSYNMHHKHSSHVV